MLWIKRLLIALVIAGMWMMALWAYGFKLGWKLRFLGLH
jgi:hypothetical protein